MTAPAAQRELFPRPDPIAAYVDHWAPILGRLATERKARELAELAELEAADATERDMKPDNRPVRPGDAVRFTAKALRSMYGGKEHAPVLAPDKRFTVVACACGSCSTGRLLAVEGGRHIALVALEHAPTALLAVDPAEHAAALAAVGVHRGEDGRYWVEPPR